ncbi:cell wall-active antibiotics response protein LiaF [Thalassobacillus sp. CUG 92003]|uniref:cell wall-active antibiotics response protein LiaF n=1 Tax=Thalassobacillus sp. CUG 92003 TaxID=2736641 RepID=UPI0015E6759E|nr:cell wall-active antibiotics response protein LiaF [Thalassobacillus sp. CUG 92003]
MVKGFFKLLAAFTFVGAGILLILTNLNIISMEISFTWASIYPALLILVGLKWWWDGVFKNGGSWAGGSFLFIFGSLLLLDRFGVILFTFTDVLKLWPLLFIYIGFSIFMGGRTRRYKEKYKTVQFEGDSVMDNDGSARKNAEKKDFSVGSQSFKKENWKVEPMSLWNAIGDYHFDFTKAFIPDQDTPISVKGWVGDVKMLIPENVPFQVSASIKAGEISVLGQKADGISRRLTYQTPDYEEATRRLTLEIHFNAGSIKVDKI